MGMTSAPGILRFTMYAVVAFVLFGIVANVIKAGIYWNQTGDYKPMIESTIGQVVYWDRQIDLGIQQLKDPTFINTLPQSFHKQYQDFVIKQIVFYLMLFAILFYGLFKFGNWLLGIQSLSWNTDVLLIIAIPFVIALMQVTYGAAMYHEYTVPYKGVSQMFKADTWELLLGDLDVVSNEELYSQGTYSPIQETTNITKSVT